MSNFFGVVVLHRSMVDWRRGWGKSAMGICAFFYMQILFGVVVHCIDLWSIGEGGSVCHGYMCSLLYVKLLWCSGVA